jgi:hypothetical protein
MLSLILATALPELPPVQQQQTPSKEATLLERIIKEGQTATERQFGDCYYAWGSWKLSADGVRTTTRQCKDESAQTPSPIAVSCPLLKVNTLEQNQWKGWRSPVAKGAKPGEANMVAALCANVVN